MYEAQSLNQQIDQLAKAAHQGAGSVYELWIDKFSLAVDLAFASAPPDVRETAIEIARSHGYATSEELDATQDEMADNGYCSHGLTWLTCPCGCFERNDDEFHEDWDDVYGVEIDD